MLSWRLSWVLFVVCVEMATTPCPGQTPDIYEGPASGYHSSSGAIRWRLAKRFDKVEFKVAPVTLLDALEELAEPYKLQFDVNDSAFKAEGVSDVLQVRIGTKPLPPMRNVTLSDALSAILERIPAKSGATFFVRRNQIEITTRQDAATTSFVALREQSRYLVESIKSLRLSDNSYFVHEASSLLSDVVHWHKVLVDNARRIRADSVAAPDGRQNK